MKGATPLFAAMRRDHIIDPARRAEVMQRVEQALIPVFANIPGCVTCYVIAPDDDSVIALAIYAGRAAAREALDRAAMGSEMAIAGLVADPPEMIIGEVTAHFPRSDPIGT